MGVENSGVLYALWSYPAQAPDELSFKDGDMVTILQKADGSDWWWASLCGREGFVPNNYFGVRRSSDDEEELDSLTITHCKKKKINNHNTTVCLFCSFFQRFAQRLSANPC